MTPRLNPAAIAPEVLKPLFALEQSIKTSGLEHSLIHLVKIRASQINGCAYCIHMHTNEARKDGESQARIDLLAAWHESPLYSDRERAALAWTESLTNLARTRAPDADYALLDSQFDDAEKVKLTMAIVAINAWNRIQISLRAIHPVAPPMTAAA